MAELAPSGGGPNRLFIILAIFLGGLLLLGLLGLGGYFLFQRFIAAPPAVPTPVVRIVSTPTRALPTQTLQPTDIPSPTFVLLSGAGTTSTPSGVSAVAITGTVAITGSITPGTGTPGNGSLPKTGVGEDLLLFAGGVVLILIVFAARRARSAA